MERWAGFVRQVRSKIRDSTANRSPAPDSTQPSDSESEDDLRSKRDEFIELIEASGGRMKQSDLVSRTEWSSATVSREVTKMETDGLVHKISLGRTNVIALLGAEPDWYTPPEPTSTATDPDSSRDDVTGDGSPILLIEDSQDEAKLLKRAFTEANVTNPIHTVRDGLDAVEFLLQRGRYAHAPTPALVLLDLGLMVVDGFEVLRELDDRKAVREVPVVVLSQSDDVTDVRRSYDEGATAYLTKPGNFDELIGLVHAIDGFWLSSNFQPPQPAHVESLE